MRRLLAFLTAGAMVVGSLFVRARLDDDTSSDGGSAPTADGGTPIALICPPELRSACDGLAEAVSVEVTVEEAGVTADRLIAQEGRDPAAWLVPDPWPSIVDEARQRAGRPALFARRQVLARSPLVALGRPLPDGCGWRCLGERSGAGDTRVGWRAPTTSAVGLLTVGAATAGYFAPDPVATNDFDAAFNGWLDGLVSNAQVDRSPVQRILQAGAFFDAALSFEAEARPALAAAAPSRSAGLSVLYPEPVATLDAVLAVAEAPSDDLVSAAADALAASGWRVGQSADPAIPTRNGLPSAGVLTALRTLAAP